MDCGAEKGRKEREVGSQETEKRSSERVAGFKNFSVEENPIPHMQNRHAGAAESGKEKKFKSGRVSECKSERENPRPTRNFGVGHAASVQRRKVIKV
jgi:hypothetical protein